MQMVPMIEKRRRLTAHVVMMYANANGNGNTKMKKKCQQYCFFSRERFSY
jgi:hypothetical protein